MVNMASGLAGQAKLIKKLPTMDTFSSIINTGEIRTFYATAY